MRIHSAVTVSTSAADDASFRALQDIARLTAGIRDSRIIGGHMVGLLLTAFPSEYAVIRRTADADTAISVEVAQTGQLHQLLIDAGYTTPSSSNRYEKEPKLVIDVLVPSDSGFHQAEHGGRYFDSVPGLRLALVQEPVLIDVDVMLLDRTTMKFRVRVPAVEMALILKSHAFASRLTPKDITDIYNLLCIVEEYGSGISGEWKLGMAPLLGHRLDTARTLHQLADQARTSQTVVEAQVPPVRLAALIRTHVAPPTS